MSKRGFISRYLLIIKKLKAKPYSSYEELQDYIDNQIDYLQMQDDSLNIGFSKRTLQRDLKEIRNLFGVDISYSKPQKGYFISQNEGENMNFQRMMEAFDMFNSLNMSQDLTPFVHLEQRRPQGTENLYGLLHAIKNRFGIKFSYQKFWEDAPSQRNIAPYALKEYRNRWYLLGLDHKDDRIKSFALDRLSVLDITKQRFQYPDDYSVEKNYRYCFGIISSEKDTPEKIILSFDSYQGKYIKTLPLHHTQQIVKDTDEELRVGLQVHITYDFVMELLSYGANMRVLEPASLKKQIKEAHQKAADLYA